MLLALVPLANASPPDQTWISGFYDNGDYDDVILIATSTVGSVEVEPAVPDCSPLSVVGFVPLPQTTARLSPVPLPSQGRAPPRS